jgi:phosphatidylserine decarboxylase
MMKKSLEISFILLQLILPKHLLSRLVAKLGDTRISWLKNLLINLAIDAFNIDIDEAISSDPDDYASFNDFFMRELKEGAREIDSDALNIISPADGLVSECGKIEKDLLIQAKGKYFDLKSLLGGDQALAENFLDGHFATIYLSPRDYHRVHMACDGKLSKSIYVPGELFSVNQITATHIRALFARNERLVNVFDSKNGLSVSIMVGAMLVAGIETVWGGQVVPPKSAISTYESGKPEKVSLKRGEEMGRFKFGSTVILLFPKDTIEWNEDFLAGKIVKMGEAIGSYTKP